MGRFSVWEIVVIVILVIVIFGGRRLPELGRGLGKGLANFRNSLKEGPDGKKEDDGPEGDAGKDKEA
ncbi:MAG: twin-arginine translocase TatA/TatE family subunit [Deltaproteobacteria bacterium]|jgi:sec-independent protein translocase protein TatA|nr:twin-arginine translocase TatA/TatE family subunit [Deltaproteobacteria bacterium]